MLIIEVFLITKEDTYLKDNYLLSSYSVKSTRVSRMALDFPLGGSVWESRKPLTGNQVKKI